MFWDDSDKKFRRQLDSLGVRKGIYGECTHPKDKRYFQTLPDRSTQTRIGGAPYQVPWAVENERYDIQSR